MVSDTKASLQVLEVLNRISCSLLPKTFSELPFLTRPLDHSETVYNHHMLHNTNSFLIARTVRRLADMTMLGCHSPGLLKQQAVLLAPIP